MMMRLWTEQALLSACDCCLSEGRYQLSGALAAAVAAVGAFGARALASCYVTGET